ncbi:Rtn protein (plasmid) [Legionella adelaidensis]|uniref:Rtn protein n=1 Tax=Legionella adelaidensis TaxID=45056 RepID=A0A0W0R3R1_9GAMM|nr:EAL domain-containing protein [Legionella adelaidensis]KTC65662.1 Rtn protein [Legionella adelaidensis]VEH85142.1 Rtn protein [Legionella adelaidensis]
MNVSATKKLNTYLVLNIVWGTLSTLLLLLVLYFTWQKERLNIQHMLYSLTNEIAEQFDNFLHSMVNKVITLDLSNNQSLTCSPALLKHMQQFIYNEPMVSGISIKNKSTHCSTVHQEVQMSNNPAGSIHLFGPFRMTNSDKPAYVLRQRLGETNIDIYLLAQVLAKHLQTNSLLAGKIALYSENDGKVILQLSRNNETNAWRMDKPFQYLKEENSDIDIMRANLIFLNNFKIILKGDLSQIKQVTWNQELIAAIIIILVSITIYYLLRALITRHFSLRRAVILAMKSERFFPMYQPIIDIKEGKCIGAEILLRWRTIDQEIITPDLFIKDVEESGLIVNITIQLAEKALQECQSLLLTNPQFHLAFNLASTHFADERFFQRFIALCGKYSIPENQIMLEITERDLLKQDDVALIRMMRQLREAGFSLAVDDFGTGHASISYLQHFPFNYLKIDQLFIKAIGTGAITETLNNSIIHMAKNLKLHIIAEGVETFTQFEFLQSQEVYLMQGWYFATAMPIEQLIQFIKGVHYE